MAAKRSGQDHERENQEILARIDVRAEYEALGVRFASREARSSGTIECFARGRDEKRPSAFVNLDTGRYVDKGGENENLSIWDFAARYGSGGTWQDWRRRFADKAGVELAVGKGRKAKKEDPLESIQFEDWTDGRRQIVTIWGRKFRQGVTLDAVLRAGGRYGRYPIWKDKNGEQRGGDYSVICLPCWAETLPPAGEPVCWVLFNATGRELPIWRGKDLPLEWAKMKTVGPSRGAMMNRHALELLASGHRPDLILKSGGPSDMLALLSAQPPEVQDRHLVLTNASGESGDVLKHQVDLLAGIPTVIFHDADTAGLVGRRKWLSAVAAAGHQDSRAARLPYRMRPKGGLDVRDFLNGIQEGGA